MNIKSRIQKEREVIPLMLKGYSRGFSSSWYGLVQKDLKKNKNNENLLEIKKWHEKGYLSNSIQKYNLLEVSDTDYISDFEYLYLKPFNNSFSKWLEDILTTNRVLLKHSEHLRKVYFSIIQREKDNLILRVGHEDREYLSEDIITLLREKGTLELRPAYWASTDNRYLLTVGVDPRSGEECYFANDTIVNSLWLKKTIRNLKRSYVITDPITISFPFKENTLDHALKIWLANDAGETPQILCAVMYIYWDDLETGSRKSTPCLVDLKTGIFKFQDKTLSIPNWETVKEELCAVSASIPQISYFTASIALQAASDFLFLRFSPYPTLPDVPFNSELNDYLKERFKNQFRKTTMADNSSRIWKNIQEKALKKIGRPGMRPYMEKLWLTSAGYDLLHTNGVTLKQKIWAHKKGFFSWHLYQYGITEENYSDFLSDYDYYWLNRINNGYQKWINDKTTFRFTMEPFKEYVPSYYFSIFKRSGETIISRMWDCPAQIPDGVAGLTALLKVKGKLALKASAGTHGDGFYCLSWENGQFAVNGEECGEDALKNLIDSLDVFYIVTEYLEMHRDLKNIYDKSVNTVRMMVVNAHGYDPRILQTYMRIGSSRTGFTDNVGYGGICVFVNKDTGELYQPETIKDHVFYDCPVHPDTGTPITGFLPNWQLVREKILDICRYLSELEYLGFDIAITDEGFQILEINIHQDLHKVADFNEEIKDYFRHKLEYKYKQYGLKSEN